MRNNKMKNNKMKRSLVIGLMMVVLFASGANAADLFDWHPGARPMSLGGAYTAAGGDVDSLNWNPAGLALLGRPAVMTGYTSSFGDVSRYYAAGAVPAFYGTLGAYVVNASLGSIPTTVVGLDGRPVITGYYSDTQWLVGLAYSQEVLTKGLDVGGALKGYQHKMSGYSVNGFGLDLGLLYDLSKSGLMAQPLPITVGLTAQNVLQPKLNWSTGTTDTVSRRIFLGAAYKGNINENPFTLSADFNPAGGSPKLWGVGAEYFVTPMFPVRLGYGNYFGSPQLGLGVGLVYQDWGLDVAYQNHPDLGGNFQISLAWRPDSDFKLFSMKTEEPAKPAETTQAEAAPQATAEETATVQPEAAAAETTQAEAAAPQATAETEIPAQPPVTEESSSTQTAETAAPVVPFAAAAPLTINDVLEKATVDLSGGKTKVYARLRSGFGSAAAVSFGSDSGEQISLTRSAMDDLYWTGSGRLTRRYDSFKIYVKLADGTVLYWQESKNKAG